MRSSSGRDARAIVAGAIVLGAMPGCSRPPAVPIASVARDVFESRESCPASTVAVTPTARPAWVTQAGPPPDLAADPARRKIWEQNHRDSVAYQVEGKTFATLDVLSPFTLSQYPGVPELSERAKPPSFFALSGCGKDSIYVCGWIYSDSMLADVRSCEVVPNPEQTPRRDPLPVPPVDGGPSEQPGL